MEPCLAIDYGTAAIRSVLVWPDGTWQVLAVHGSAEPSGAVHVSGDTIVAGAQAWQRAATEPEGLVADPLSTAGSTTCTIAGVTVETTDLAAAALRPIADAASRVSGAPIQDVRLVVPAGWGPARRTWLRQAARRAGLLVTRLIPAPAAIVRNATVDGTSTAAFLTVDLGTRCEVTLIQTGPDGPEVLATQTTPDAGGNAVDDALWNLLIRAPGPDEQRFWPDDETAAVPDETQRTSLRQAKVALTGQPAVVVPIDGRPAMIVNVAQMHAAAAGPLQQAGKLAAAVLNSTDMTAHQLSGIYLIGAAAETPGAVPVFAQELGVSPRIIPQPGWAAVLGAGNAEPVVPAAAGVPPPRRVLTLTLPGVLSLVLYSVFVFSADFYNGTPASRQAGYYVLAPWGLLTAAAVLAAITFVQAASLLAEVLDRGDGLPGLGLARGHDGSVGAESSRRTRITGGLLLAAAATITLSALYAITAAVFFAYPIGMLLRWSLLPLLPFLAAMLATAILTWRRTPPPGVGWDAVLTFPASSVLTAAIGLTVVAAWWHGGLPWWAGEHAQVLGRAGGLLTGVGAGCAVVRHPGVRVVVAGVLGFFCVLISQAGPDILAVLYACSAAVWATRCAWGLLRSTGAVRDAPVDRMTTAPAAPAAPN